jgi:hypothetical protein
MQSGLPVHNPEPRTERGKRRHEARNEAGKAAAVKAWAKPRSAYPRCRPNSGAIKLTGVGHYQAAA